MGNPRLQFTRFSFFLPVHLSSGFLVVVVVVVAASIFIWRRAANCARNMRASAENQFVIKTTNEKDIKVDMAWRGQLDYMASERC